MAWGTPLSSQARRRSASTGQRHGSTGVSLTISVLQPCMAATPYLNCSLSPSSDSCRSKPGQCLSQLSLDAHHLQRVRLCDASKACLVAGANTFSVIGLLRYAPMPLLSASYREKVQRQSLGMCSLRRPAYVKGGVTQPVICTKCSTASCGSPASSLL